MDNNHNSNNRLFLIILVINIISISSYLLVALDESLIGYLAIPVLLISYLAVLVMSLYLIFIGLCRTFIPAIIIAILYLTWLTYAIGSEAFGGIDFKLMISLMFINLLVNLYFYRMNNK